METKVCARCGEEKLLEEFRIQTKSKDGHSYSCKKCDREYEKKRWKKIVEEGKCTTCLKREPLLGTKTCQHCLDIAAKNRDKRREEINEQSRARRLYRKREGLCDSCGKQKENREKKYCNRCSEEQNEKNRERKRKRRELGICILCGKSRAVKGKAYCKKCFDKEGEQREKNREKKKKQQRERTFDFFYKVVMALGGKCACCGENRLWLLTVDHINGRKGITDKRHLQSGKELYRVIIEESFPKDIYQILCYSCNCGKHYGEYCPHSEKFKERVSERIVLRKKVIKKYGGRCMECGENNFWFLTIDHVNGGGKKEMRERFNSNLDKFFRYLLKNPISSKYQVLCYNCNCSKNREWLKERVINKNENS